MISVIDVGLGNFISVANILKKLGKEVKLENSYDQISKSRNIILPGVGRFDVFMEQLKKFKIDHAIKNAIENNSKILGICVGMHVLLDESEEGNCEGLKIIKGKVKKFSFDDHNFKIPHMGWNSVKSNNSNLKILNEIEKSKFYFIHSYFAEPENYNHVAGITRHKHDFASIINKDNVTGLQFHPEKSHFYGKELLKKFLNA